MNDDPFMELLLRIEEERRRMREEEAQDGDKPHGEAAHQCSPRSDFLVAMTEEEDKEREKEECEMRWEITEIINNAAAAATAHARLLQKACDARPMRRRCVASIVGF